jgi:hypothetical protein
MGGCVGAQASSACSRPLCDGLIRLIGSGDSVNWLEKAHSPSIPRWELEQLSEEKGQIMQSAWLV